jgi:hypothetical protein
VSELYRPCEGRMSRKLVPIFADRGVSRCQRGGSLWQYSRFSRPEQLLFLPSSSSVVLTSMSGPRSRPTTSEKIWKRRESNSDLWICSQEVWPLYHRAGPYMSNVSLYRLLVTVLAPLAQHLDTHTHTHMSDT